MSDWKMRRSNDEIRRDFVSVETTYGDEERIARLAADVGPLLTENTQLRGENERLETDYERLRMEAAALRGVVSQVEAKVNDLEVFGKNGTLSYGIGAAAPEDVDWLVGEVERLTAAQARIRALHHDNGTELGLRPWCGYCQKAYPCPTLAALDGDGVQE